MELRNKTIKRFSKDDLPLVIKFIKAFVLYEPDIAKELLEWATYDPEKFLQVNKWHMPVTHLEQLTALRGDLKAFYLEAHPDCVFLIPHDFPEELSNKLGKDLLVLNSIRILAEKTLSENPKSEINRILFLLNSEEENLKYGGLRALGCSTDMSKYLLLCTKEIAAYFESLANSPKQEESKEQSKVAKSVPADESSSAAKKAPANTNVSSIMSVVMENQDFFLKLQDMREKVAGLNLSLPLFNEENMDKLSKLIQAISAF